jgi:TRAP-type transport system periplasmic protein
MGDDDMIKPLLKSVAGIAVALSMSTVPSWAQQYTFSLADQNSPTSLYELHAIGPWAKRVEEATKGRVKIRVYPSQTLVKATEAWKAVKGGIADIAWCFHGYWADMTPNTDVLTMPFLPFPTAEKAGEVAWTMYERYPVIQKEFEDVKVLMLWISNAHILLSNKRLVKSLDDIKGMKIRVTGGPPTEQIRAMGGVPMLMPQPDVYDALDKGVIDAAAASWEAMHGYRQYEVARYQTIVPMSSIYFSMVMNKQKWNSLPKDIQDQIMSVSGLEGSKAMGKGAYDSAKDVIEKTLKDNNIKFERYVVPEEDVARWRKIAGDPVREAWLQKMEAKGNKQVRELLAAVEELISK